MGLSEVQYCKGMDFGDVELFEDQEYIYVYVRTRTHECVFTCRVVHISMHRCQLPLLLVWQLSPHPPLGLPGSPKKTIKRRGKLRSR